MGKDGSTSRLSWYKQQAERKQEVCSCIDYRTLSVSLSLADCNTVVRSLGGQMTQTLISSQFSCIQGIQGGDYVGVSRIFLKSQMREEIGSGWDISYCQEVICIKHFLSAKALRTRWNILGFESKMTNWMNWMTAWHQTNRWAHIDTPYPPVRAKKNDCQALVPKPDPILNQKQFKV